MRSRKAQPNALRVVIGSADAETLFVEQRCELDGSAERYGLPVTVCEDRQVGMPRALLETGLDDDDGTQKRLTIYMPEGTVGSFIISHAAVTAVDRSVPPQLEVAQQGIETLVGPQGGITVKNVY